MKIKLKCAKKVSMKLTLKWKEMKLLDKVISDVWDDYTTESPEKIFLAKLTNLLSGPDVA